jgi:ribonuclease P protein component
MYLSWNLEIRDSPFRQIMLKKDQRLNLKTSFRWVSSGHRAENKFCVVFYRSGQNIQPLVGIATSGKYFKSSVSRNTAKRRASTAIQGSYSRLIPQLNLVIMPKSPILDAPMSEIEASTRQMLRKLQLINNA